MIYRLYLLNRSGFATESEIEARDDHHALTIARAMFQSSLDTHFGFEVWQMTAPMLGRMVRREAQRMPMPVFEDDLSIADEEQLLRPHEAIARSQRLSGLRHMLERDGMLHP